MKHAKILVALALASATTLAFADPIVLPTAPQNTTVTDLGISGSAQATAGGSSLSASSVFGTGSAYHYSWSRGDSDAAVSGVYSNAITPGNQAQASADVHQDTHSGSGGSTSANQPVTGPMGQPLNVGSAYATSGTSAMGMSWFQNIINITTPPVLPSP